MKVITICGSLKFQNEMLRIARKKTLEGNVVITSIFPVDKNYSVTPSEKEMFARVHREKIKLADAILVELSERNELKNEKNINWFKTNRRFNFRKLYRFHKANGKFTR